MSYLSMVQKKYQVSAQKFSAEFYSELSDSEKKDILGNLSSKKFTVDGERVNIKKVLDVNDFHVSELKEMLNLKVNEEMQIGGGAAATFIWKRIS